MKLKRLVAGVLSAAMMLSVGSTLAFAADGVVKVDDAEKMTFTSTINLSENAISAPAVTYTYTLETGTDHSNYTYTDDDSNSFSIPISNGVLADSASNNITTEVNVSFDAFDYAQSTTEGDDTTYYVTEDVTFDFSDVAYTAAGIYYYTITETTALDSSVAANSYKDDQYATTDADGTTTSVRHVYVTVTVSTDNTGTETYAISEIIMSSAQIVSENASYDKSDSYDHSYGIVDDDDITGDDSLTYILTQYAFGDMASANDDFDYTVDFSGVADGTVYAVTKSDSPAYIMVIGGTAYEVYKVTDGYAATASGTVLTAVPTDVSTSGLTEYTFSLVAGKAFEVFAVAEGVTVKASISDSEGYGYNAQTRVYETTTWGSTSTTITKTEQVLSPSTTMLASDADTNGYQGLDVAAIKGSDPDPEDEDEDDDGIIYSGGFPSTGVILEFAPFALMALAAGAVITLRLASASKQRK